MIVITVQSAVAPLMVLDDSYYIAFTTYWPVHSNRVRPFRYGTQLLGQAIAPILNRIAQYELFHEDDTM